MHHYQFKVMYLATFQFFLHMLINKLWSVISIRLNVYLTVEFGAVWHP